MCPLSPRKPKIFLVSDTAQFALTDVYYGYAHALEKLGVEYTAYPLHQFIQHHKEHICYSVIHSEALTKENGYTHVVFIGGLNIPPRMLESFHGGVKTVVIATEDPHTFDPLRDRLDLIDYYFTNERSVCSLKYDNVHYLPTAADSQVCGAVPSYTLPASYHSDVLFLGAIYPNRHRMLKGLLPLVREFDINLKILGHPHYMDKKSPLWDYIPPENFDKNGNLKTVDHEDTVKYYNGAKIVLNFFRDVQWNPLTTDKSNPFNKGGIVPESLNPRAYEVPMCGSFMLMEDTRAEAREVFNDSQVGFFGNPRQLRSQVKKYLLRDDSEDVRNRMARSSFIKVSSQHTYVQRAQTLLKTLETDDGGDYEHGRK